MRADPAAAPRLAALLAVLPAVIPAVFIGACAAPPATDGPDWPVVVSLDLARPEVASRFACSDPAAWTWRDGALELTGASDYAPPHRSPRSIALLAEYTVGDFELEFEALQTGREYGHRDLCVFFGFESPERYYYVHLATTPDPNAHNVFLVDRAPRRNLAPVAERGVEWGTGEGHTVRVVRRGAVVEVSFDGETVLRAEDATIGEGRVGVGSFDDTGRFRRIRLRAPTARFVRGASAPFSAP